MAINNDFSPPQEGPLWVSHLKLPLCLISQAQPEARPRPSLVQTRRLLFILRLTVLQFTSLKAASVKLTILSKLDIYGHPEFMKFL